MATGPVQLIVLGFDDPDFHGEIVEELGRLRKGDTVRVIDALAVHKDAGGEILVAPLGPSSGDDALAAGTTIGALVGLGDAGLGPAARGLHAFAEEDSWDVIGDIPPDTGAALILVEHRWAVSLCDAVMRAGGFRIAHGFVDPFDLAALGLLSAEEAEQQAAFAR